MAKSRPPLYTLGIHAAFHDSPAALVPDGVVVPAAEEAGCRRLKPGRSRVQCANWAQRDHGTDHWLD
ncbi:hypothetical protein [Burkholderia pseudomallei]|uniref:hypothetical protein n=1 Tax=Burkholderia pseudomallei TaxID=28450 RepID=UPI000CCF1DFB|nr:hypothetical protein [Burkholderia pseudomallei]PNX19905.1 hypothetical protein CF642_38420 [Burkholderia pseudomallei]PNX19906.1 hypothetical protein CF642_38425 [Burkholderia pseudomallei]